MSFQDKMVMLTQLSACKQGALNLIPIKVWIGMNGLKMALTMLKYLKCIDFYILKKLDPLNKLLTLWNAKQSNVPIAFSSPFKILMKKYKTSLLFQNIQLLSLKKR